MTQLTIDNATTVTNTADRFLNISVVGPQNINVITVTGPMGPPGTGGGGGFISGFAGVTYLNSLSGAINLIGNNGIYVYPSGNNLIISYSGSGGSGVSDAALLTLSGYLSNLLTATGVALDNQIDALSGFTIARDASISGAFDAKLTSTGIQLGNQISSLSGLVMTASGALQAQITDGVGTQVHVTGSPTLSNADFTGVGSVTVSVVGSRVFFSGAQSSGSGGISQSQLDALSGYSDSTFATKNSLNIVSGNLIQSGNTLISYINSVGNTLSGNLTLTGQQIGNISGAIAQNLTNTGVALINRDNAISGGLEVRIISTGNSVLNHANSIGQTLSGNLTSTGLQIGLVSGALDTRIIASGNSAINHSNGIGNILSGNLTQTGINLLSIIFGGDTNLSGRLTQTGVILNAAITGVSGYLISLISAASAGVSSLNGASGVITIQGAGNVSVINAGQTIIISGSGSSAGGVTQGQLDSLSGYSDNTFATKTSLGLVSGNLIQTGVQLINRDNAISGGLEVRIIATGNSVVTHTNSIGSTISGNVTITGQTLLNLITGMSGQGINDYATKVSLAATGQQAWTAADANSRTISGNLTSTGVQLGAEIDILSGYLNSGFATITTVNLISGNLIQTGVQLINRDNAISGGLEVRIIASGNSAVAHANSIGQTLSGNLTQTGLQIAGISGALDTKIVATGTSAINHANGIGSILSGNITISGQTLQSRIDLISGNLIQTGVQLINRENSISGGLEIRIIATGQSVLAHANSIGSTISGNLTQTGIQLSNKINSLSGYNESIYVHRTGDESISGNKTFTTTAFTVTDTNNNTILSTNSFALFYPMSASQSINWGFSELRDTSDNTSLSWNGRTLIDSSLVNSLNWENRALSGEWLTNAAGNTNQTVVNVGRLTGVSGALNTKLILTGQTLGLKIDLLSGFVTGVSGYLQSQLGGGGVTIGQLNSLSGWTNSNFVHRSGDELVSGTKIFANNIAFANGVPINIGNLNQTPATGSDSTFVVFGYNNAGVMTGNNVVMGHSNIYGTSGIGVGSSANTGNYIAGISNRFYGSGSNIRNNVIDGSNNLFDSFDASQAIVNVMVGSNQQFLNGSGTSTSNVLIGVANVVSVTNNTSASAITLLGSSNGFRVDNNLSPANTSNGNTILGYVNSINANSGDVSATTLVGATNVVNFNSGIGSSNNGIFGNQNTFNINSGQQISNNYILGSNNIINQTQISNGRNNLIAGTNNRLSTGAFNFLFGQGLNIFGLTGTATFGLGTGLIHINSGQRKVFVSGMDLIVANNNLGIGTANPIVKLQVNGDSYLSGNLLIDSGSNNIQPIYPDNPLAMGGSGIYLQANIRNRSNASNSSSDWVATNDIGSNISGYVNLGINSSTYNDPAFSITTGNDAYLYVDGGDLAIGTASANKVIKFHTSGTNSGSLRLTIDTSGINLASGEDIRLNNVSLGTRPYAVPFSTAVVSWSNMPAAINFFGSATNYITYVDLQGFTGVNLVVNKGATASAQTGAMWLGMRGDPNFTASNYIPLTANNSRVLLNVASTIIQSGYQPLAAGARSGVYIALLASGGSAAVTPIFGNITAYFK